MTIIITTKLSRNKKKTWYYFEWGKAAGQRVATGIFTYEKPKDQIQKNHNKEALNILETKRSHLILDRQSIGTAYLPKHKLKSNFLDYYREFVENNSRDGNRSLACSLSSFEKFMDKPHITPSEITESLCEQFRQYLLDNLNGETPSDYFMRFKRVLYAAAKDGYFKYSPAEHIAAKSNPVSKKEILTSEEYTKLMKAYCSNHEVKKAAIFCLYTGLRWVDVSKLTWDCIKETTIAITQKKTGHPLEIPLHKIAKKIIGNKKDGLVFKLPTQDGANKVLGKWVRDAGIDKHITWHSLRHSISVLLQDAGTDVATVAGILGHTTTKYVHKTYQRYKLDSAKKAVNKLPST